MLSVEELMELEDSIREELNENLTAALTRMNRSGDLEVFLQLLGMEHLIRQGSGYKVLKMGRSSLSVSRT